MNKSVKFLLGIVFVSLASVAVSSCGSAITDVQSTSTGSVTLKSDAYSTSAKPTADSQAKYAGTVTDFQFCITKIQMTNSGGTDVGVGSIEAVLGLVDVSDSTVPTEWGVLEIPVDFTLSELTVEVHRDPENCSQADYSLSYNGNQLLQDLEFKFTFNPAISLNDNDVLSLAMSNIATTFQTAADAGTLNDENITSFIESLTETGQEE